MGEVDTWGIFNQIQKTIGFGCVAFCPMAWVCIWLSRCLLCLQNLGSGGQYRHPYLQKTQRGTSAKIVNNIAPIKPFSLFFSHWVCHLFCLVFRLANKICGIVYDSWMPRNSYQNVLVWLGIPVICLMRLLKQITVRLWWWLAGVWMIYQILSSSHWLHLDEKNQPPTGCEIHVDQTGVLKCMVAILAVICIALGASLVIIYVYSECYLLILWNF